ncbi:uncharacterized protein VTP21DRAFT_1800 [Calcarisporiella thermophila]|uniref:uncharacterized protein n=1 Tax=Calcarisporiella thermophila TaxID=911321 RepID=UPI0037430208
MGSNEPRKHGSEISIAVTEGRRGARGGGKRKRNRRRAGESERGEKINNGNTLEAREKRRLIPFLGKGAATLARSAAARRELLRAEEGGRAREREPSAASSSNASIDRRSSRPVCRVYFVYWNGSTCCREPCCIVSTRFCLPSKLYFALPCERLQLPHKASSPSVIGKTDIPFARPCCAMVAAHGAAHGAALATSLARAAEERPMKKIATGVRAARVGPVHKYWLRQTPHPLLLCRPTWRVDTALRPDKRRERASMSPSPLGGKSEAWALIRNS